MKDHFYLTTTLPYVNAEPHIGHALEFIQADVIARYKRQQLGDEKVFFNVGTDEHGLKMFQGAEKEGLSPQEYVDKYAQRFKDFCELFNISYNKFYRTSDQEHKDRVQKFWKLVEAKGDIYKDKYEGLYCIGCEEFKLEKDLVEGKCPLHNKEPIEYSEENYFFKLSNYREKLLDYIDKNPGFIKPDSKTEELKNFIKQMNDISISRSKESLPWGVEVPDDPSQVVYVWFDALTNYIFAVGYPEDEKDFNKWWPGIQLCGPDNLRFQGAIWQGMLASLDIPQTTNILVHGMILGPDGTKMSKTIGNVVSPFELLEKYGSEATRYYLVSGIQTYGDTAFSYELLESKYKSDLQNNFGNLLNRVITLINRKEVQVSKDKVEADFEQKISKFKQKYEQLMDEYELSAAMDEVQKLAEFGNKYITEKEPWSKNANPEHVNLVLNNLYFLLQSLVELYSPVIPESAKKAKAALSNKENIILFGSLDEK